MLQRPKVCTNEGLKPDQLHIRCDLEHWEKSVLQVSKKGWYLFRWSYVLVIYGDGMEAGRGKRNGNGVILGI